MSGPSGNDWYYSWRYAICVGKADMPSPLAGLWTLLTDVARWKQATHRVVVTLNTGTMARFIGSELSDARLHHGRTILGDNSKSYSVRN